MSEWGVLQRSRRNASSGNNFLGGIGQAISGDHIQAAFFQHPLAFFHFSSFKPNDQGNVEANFF
jgi:hypothetical protein